MTINHGLEGIVKRAVVALALGGTLLVSACGYQPKQPAGTLPPPQVYAESPTRTPFQPELEYTSSPTLEPSPTMTPVPTESPTPASTPTEECEGEKKVVVDISEQMIYAVIDYACSGERDFVNSSLVSTGVAAHPTVLGEYQIYVKLDSTTMSGEWYYLENVPYTMYFYEGYSIHGAYWHHNFGHPMSHGCVNMPIDPVPALGGMSEAEWFYDWGYVGMKVIVQP
jgi:lipoprotein-anchoring transpeptidase ErfK/SrfK